MNTSQFRAHQARALHGVLNPATDDTTDPDAPQTVADAIAALRSRVEHGDLTDAKAYTNAGLPDCRVLSQMLGREVTANERNTAWKGEHHEGT